MDCYYNCKVIQHPNHCNIVFNVEKFLLLPKWYVPNAEK